jgi:hypothetical protein
MKRQLEKEIIALKKKNDDDEVMRKKSDRYDEVMTKKSDGYDVFILWMNNVMMHADDNVMMHDMLYLLLSVVIIMFTHYHYDDRVFICHCIL